MMEKREKNRTHNESNDAVPSPSASPLEAILVHSVCGLSLASAIWVAHIVYSINLISHPSQTLQLISVTVAPIVILVYSGLRKNPRQCSYWRAVGRGLLGLLAGALVNALGAIALGAPVGSKCFPGTLYWSLLMSSFNVAPAASVFGSYWTDWLRLFAHTKPAGSVDYMICLPGHGAVVGAWFGAWPMPLDWERPWQEWPICVTYGAIFGYVVGMIASFGFVLLRGDHFQRAKVE